jgi:acyl-coenzyme A synthetase/AMP-(fatty) acid ligase
MADKFTSGNTGRPKDATRITTWLLGISGDEALHPKELIKNEVIV